MFSNPILRRMVEAFLAVFIVTFAADSTVVHLASGADPTIAALAAGAAAAVLDVGRRWLATR